MSVPDQEFAVSVAEQGYQQAVHHAANIAAPVADAIYLELFGEELDEHGRFGIGNGFEIK